MGNITEMLASSGDFRDPGIEWRQRNSATTDPGCHGNEIDTIDYYSVTATKFETK